MSIFAVMFKFKHFTIDDSHCAHKVGTDGVLLGAWAAGGNRVLDIGTGSGLIALMMAQRFAEAQVEGLEMDEASARQAAENFACSPYAARTVVRHGRLQDFVCPAEHYDAIVCNPPFFVRSLRNPDERKAHARHEDSLPFEVLFESASRWLRSEGELSVIVPCEILEDITHKAKTFNLLPTQLILVKTTPHKQPKRALVAFRKDDGGRDFSTEKNEQILTLDGQKRSDWYAELTRDFYL